MMKSKWDKRQRAAAAGTDLALDVLYRRFLECGLVVKAAFVR
jgi:hypothetical protein